MVLINILKILEVDRLLLYTYNALVIDVVIGINPQEDNPDIIYIKESLRFVTMLFFKRAFLIMNVLKSLKSSSQLSEIDN